MKDLFKIYGYIRNYKKEAVFSVVFNLFFVVFGLFSVVMVIPFMAVLFDSNPEIVVQPEFAFDKDAIMDCLYYYINNVVSDPERGRGVALLYICAFTVLMTFFKTATRFVSLYFLAPLRTGIVKDIRDEIFSKIINLPISYYNNKRKGDILSRVSSDVQEIQVSIVSSLESFVRDPIMIIFYIFFLFFLSAKLTLFVIILLPVSGYLIGTIGKNLKSTSLKGQQKLGDLMSIIEETISGLKIIKAFNNEENMKEKFYKHNGIFTWLNIKVIRKRSLASPLSEFLGTIVMVSILWYGGNIIFNHPAKMASSELIGYLVIFYLIINPSKAFSTAYYNVQKGLASTERINKILDADIIIKDKPDAQPINGFSEYIEYRDVSFKYENDYVLNHINYKIEKGKTIAIVGQSGSGKSTLVDLLPRLINLDEGDIIIDGKSINNLKIKDLRALMGVVTQQSILFYDTVFNNIAFGISGATEADVIEAAKVANAHDFILQMPAGYQTNIGDMGIKLSGGQRQRLSIARAIFKNPPILILDEATSALDTESEKLVQDALINLMKNRTSIVIAHRLSTIKHADEILVMHKGDIVEKGKHDVLLKQGGVYKRLYDLQMFA